MGTRKAYCSAPPVGSWPKTKTILVHFYPKNRLLLTEFQHMLLNAVPLRYLSDVKMNTAEKTPDFHLSGFEYKKLSYRRVTARCVLSVVILPITTQQCRNYLYDKS